MADLNPGASIASRVEDPIVSVKTLFKTVLKRIWIVILLCVLFCGIAVGLSALQTPRYEASATILIGQGQGITQSPNEAVGLQQLTQTMATAADSQRIYEPVIEEFNLGLSPSEFEDRFSVQQLSATQFIEIRYTDTNAETAQQVTNALAGEFSDQIDEISENSSQVTATVWNRAETPGEPVSPQPMRNGLLALFFGGVLGVGVALLMEFFDDSWSSPEEAERISGVPTFGVVPEFAPLDGKKQKLGLRSGPVGRRGRRSSTVGTNGGADTTDRVAETPSGQSISEGLTALPVGIASADSSGEIIEANATLRQMLGLSEGEIAGQSISGLASHPDDVEHHQSLMERLISGERSGYEVEKRLIRNGELIWCRFGVSRVGNSGDESFVAVVQDITEQKQAEERLRLASESERLSNERLRTLFDNPLIAVHSFTPDGYSLASDADWESLWKNGSSDGGSNGNIFSNERMRTSGLTSYVEHSISNKEMVATPPLELNGNGNGSYWIQASIHPIVDESHRVSEVWITAENVTREKRAEDRLSEVEEELAHLREEIQASEQRRIEAERESDAVETLKMELKAAQESRARLESELGAFRRQFRGLLQSMSGTDEQSKES